MNPGLKKPYAYEGLERETEMGPSPLWFENELCLLLSYIVALQKAGTLSTLGIHRF